MQSLKPHQVVQYAIEEEKRLTVKASGYFSKERNCIDQILKLYLKNLGIPRFFNQIAYCLHEIAGNANKANTKRVYFKKRGLSLNSPKDYVLGMEDFKEDTVSRIEYYHNLQKENNLWIKFHFALSPEHLSIRIRNNAPLTVEEKERIQSKFKSAAAFDTIADAYTSIEDSSEGAGLGIVMMILMLRELGFGDHVLSMTSDEEITTARLELDLGTLHKNIGE